MQPWFEISTTKTTYVCDINYNWIDYEIGRKARIHNSPDQAGALVAPTASLNMSRYLRAYILSYRLVIKPMLALTVGVIWDLNIFTDKAFDDSTRLLLKKFFDLIGVWIFSLNALTFITRTRMWKKSFWKKSFFFGEFVNVSGRCHKQCKYHYACWSSFMDFSKTFATISQKKNQLKNLIIWK